MKLGITLRDKVSGFTGIAVNKSDFMTGNVQFSLQGPVKDGALPEPISFDAHQLEEVPGASVTVIAPPAETGVVLGEKVQDIVTKVEGIAIRKVTFLNGCVYYIVQCEKDKEGKTLEDFVEWKRLKRLSAGVVKTIEAKTVPAKGASVPTGGPSFRIAARR